MTTQKETQTEIPTQPKIEHRFIGWEEMEVKEETRENGAVSRIIRGYAAVFNKLSDVIWDFREKIAPGAFASSLKNDIVALWSHDSNLVLGRSSNNTLTLSEDEKGLKFALDLDTDHWGEFAYRKVQRGDVKGVSFGFRVPKNGDSWDMDANKQLIRTLNKIDLIEISPTAFPAYPQTSVSARSHMTDEEVYKRGLELVAQKVDQEENPDPEGRARMFNAKRRLIGAC